MKQHKKSKLEKKLDNHLPVNLPNNIRTIPKTLNNDILGISNMTNRPGFGMDNVYGGTGFWEEVDKAMKKHVEELFPKITLNSTGSETILPILYKDEFGEIKVKYN